MWKIQHSVLFIGNKHIVCADMQCKQINQRN